MLIATGNDYEYFIYVTLPNTNFVLIVVVESRKTNYLDEI